MGAKQNKVKDLNKKLNVKANDNKVLNISFRIY